MHLNSFNFEECNCDCHNENSSMMHCMPCCYECPTCSRNIRKEYYFIHKEKCEKENGGQNG